MSFLNEIRRFLAKRKRNARYRRILRRGDRLALEEWFPLWSTSEALYRGPVGYGMLMTPETCALDKVVAETAITDEQLLAGGEHESLLVAAYCVEALGRRKSPLLAQSAVRLRNRPGVFLSYFGCIGGDRSLASLVDEYLRESGYQAAARPELDRGGA